MRKYLVSAIAFVFTTLFAINSAISAEVNVNTLKDGSTYISYDGETEVGDIDKVKAAYAQATAEGKTFSGFISLRGPGGVAWEGKQIADFINEMGMTTYVGDYCVSACSLMWMAGDNKRFIGKDAWGVGFHFAYVAGSDGVDYLNGIQAESGWLGVQDEISQRTHYYTAQLLKYRVNNVYEFMMGLSKHGSHDGAFIINADNAHIVGARII